MNPDLPPKVFFEEFGPAAFRIRFIYWYAPPAYWDFMEYNGKLSLEIFRALESEGIQFSLPLRHSYWKHDDQQGPLEIQVLENSGTLGRDLEECTK
jgi:MscS family membrane protein